MLNIIVAIANNGAIGRKGDLLFPVSADLKRFKALTMGHPILMGRKTFESFPKGPLPGRRNIVITRNKDYGCDGAETAASLTEAVEMASDADEIFIIGGGEIYRQAFTLADRMMITEIDADAPDADTFFPEIDSSQWLIAEQSEYETDPRSGVSYRFTTLVRKK